MAIYPATYIVQLIGPSDNLPEGVILGGLSGNEPRLMVWAFSQQEALRKARQKTPAGYRIHRVERQGSY